MGRQSLTLLIAVALLGTGSRAQQPVFSVQSDLVVLHVTVTDRRGAYVQSLSRDAFTVIEEGERQTVSFLADTDTPVTVGLLIDSSGSMLPTRELVLTAAEAFAAASNPQDEIFALAFNEHVRSALPPATPFTSDPQALRAALDRVISARGQTALYDAVLHGLAYLNRGTRQRKVLVLVSDGGDNASEVSVDHVFRLAQASNAMIYAIALRDSVRSGGGNPRLLRRLAEVTGGAAFTPEHPREVADALRQIATDIRHTYTIGFVPTAATRDGSFRRVQVQVKQPDGRRLQVRTRGGYLAGPA